MQDQKLIDKIHNHLSDSPPLVNKLQDQDPDKKKKKSKLILRRTKNNVPLLLNYSYIFKISESLIINERALKQPTVCHESFMASIFYFKSIHSLSVNSQFVSMSLKEVQQNQFPICYYTERFKSFGDREFYQLAQSIELLDLQLTKKYIQPEVFIEQQQQRRLLKKQLADFMEQKKGKKIICFYSQPTGDHVTMNKIIVSTDLLKALGYKVEQLCRDFLRYRHVFFEIFDTQFYCQIVKKAKQRLNSLKENVEEKKNPQQKQVSQNSQNEQTFTSNIYCVRQDEKGLFQQKLPASITFSKPYPHLSVYQINEIDESKVVLTVPQKHPKHNQEIKQYEQKLLYQQRQTLDNLGYENLQK